MKRVLWFGALLALGLTACSDFEPIAPDGTVRPAFDQVVTGPVVNTTDDVVDASGCDDIHCSLREAIAFASPGATITFAGSVTGTITLTATLQINKNLTITGPGAGQLTVSGNNLYRVFTFGAGVTASLSGLTIADGSADNGGGISKGAGTLTLTDCIVSDNRATGVGGGIYQPTGTLTLNDCVVSGNRAEGAGGGGGILSYGGGVISITESTISGNIATTGSSGGMYAYLSTVTLERSTFSGNSAYLTGGGARFQYGSTTILNSTISGNTAGNGGGIYRFVGTTRIILSTITDNNGTAGVGGVILYDGGTETNVKGSIIWGNTGTTADDVGGAAGGYHSMGYNLIGTGSGTVRFNEATDQTGVTDALLGPLQLNGPGTTKTHALLAGSPAIDAGTCTDLVGAPVLTDQRGVTRPQGITCDIGAYELSPAEAVESLMEYVEALGPDGTGTLNGGQTNSLLVTLDVVLKKLEDGQKNVALNTLWAFIGKVEAFTAGGVLTAGEGQPLIDIAEQIIASIEAM